MGKIAVVISFDTDRLVDTERMISRIVHALRPIFVNKSRVEVQVTHDEVARAVLAEAASYSGKSDTLQRVQPQRVNRYPLSDYLQKRKAPNGAGISRSR